MALQNDDLILVGRGTTSYNTQFNEFKTSVFSGSYNDLTDKPDIGNGQIQVNAGPGLSAAGNQGTANQLGDTIRTLSLNSGDGLQINLGDNSVEIDLNYLNQNLDTFPEAPADGNIYARKGVTGTWVRALPYDISTLQDLA